MFRLTFRRNDTDDDPAAWTARVRNAVPDSMLVAAYLEGAVLDIYLDGVADADVDNAMNAIADALGLGEWRVYRIVPLTHTEARSSLPVPTTALARMHPGQIVAVTVSPDGWKVSVKVRHAQYERVDRVDRAETDDAVELGAWVGSEEDDPRADFATLGQLFSDVTVELDRPLAGRPIVYDNG